MSLGENSKYDECSPPIVHRPEQIDFQCSGKRHYRLAFHLDSSWGYSLLPLTIINGLLPPPENARPGLAAFAGTHGNEWEGQIAVRRLCRELKPEDISGTIILMPQLSPSACAANQRLSPLDHVNMNRAFPGDPRGTISLRIANFVTTQIFPRVGLVVDLHAGGREGGFALCTSFHRVPDPNHFAEIAEAASLFDLPFMLVYSSGMASGLLTSQAEAEGKISIGGEFGFGEGINRKGVRHACEGIRNLLKHYGMLRGEITKIDFDRAAPSRLVDASNLEDYIPAPHVGVWEPLVDLGDLVFEGQLIGYLHDVSRQESLPTELHAHRDGYLMMMCGTAQCVEGTTLYVIAAEMNTPDQVSPQVRHLTSLESSRQCPSELGR